MSNKHPKSSEAPTPAEWKILRIVHSMESCAAREIVASATDTFGWSMSTTKTLLRRLVDKGHLQTERVGNSFLYSPSQSALKMLCKEADGLLANAVDNAVGPLLSYMVKKSQLSKSDLEELRALLDEKEAGQ
ncbi:MAG: BlaI/MecI/CopY family transcriptional regulator [Planctomycetota bacterium]|nr:BlaI/MecI/CopY family transcriptional regulator [Planctomycetota bacterium]